MDLTTKERWMLSNQFAILEKLDGDSADLWRGCKDVVDHGWELEYSWISGHIYEPMSADACSEVIHILDMWCDIESSYESLQDKGGIEEWSVKFHGWDGNNEGSQMTYAKHLIGQEKFEQLGERGYANAHAPTLQRHRPMLAKWREITSGRMYQPLKKGEIMEIVKAWTDAKAELDAAYEARKRQQEGPNG